MYLWIAVAFMVKSQLSQDSVGRLCTYQPCAISKTWLRQDTHYFMWNVIAYSHPDVKSGVGQPGMDESFKPTILNWYQYLLCAKSGLANLSSQVDHQK